MSDLQNQNIPAHYRMLNRGKVKNYAIQDNGTKTLTTALGELPVRHIQRGDDKRLLQFWLGKNQNYAPLKIIQLENGKEELRLEIRRLE
jgi:hypothetical protein